MKILLKISTQLLAVMCLTVGVMLTSCSDDDLSTDQYLGGVSLNSFGPCPVARGGELRFLGSGMDKITSIIIPGCEPITNITVINNQEIRVTVPQTALVGYVTLVYANGTIQTVTPIGYSEPISYEAMTPNPIKAGETLTITGEYLNLIQEVIFATDVVVPIEDFISSSRNQIQVVVPAKAQTGKIIISDGAETPNWIYSDEELKVALPTVTSVVDQNDAKPGQVITITGTDFDLIDKVTLPNGEEVTFTISGNTLTFTLPADTTDGVIHMVPQSGVEVPIVNLTMAVPEGVVATPNTGLRAGDVITITGTNLDVVTDVTFAGVSGAVNLDTQTATQITVTMPTDAISGELTLNTGSGKTATVTITTLKPEATSYAPNPVPAGDDVTFTGTNLDLVTAVIFTGTTDEITPSAVSATSLTVKSSVVAETGVVTFVMANGERVTSLNVTIDKPSCCFVSSVLADKYVINTIYQFTVTNETLLTNVTINGAAVQYLLDGTTLSVKMPNVAEGTYPMELTSSNGSISYNLNIVSPETQIWSGSSNVGNWGGFSDLSWGGYDWSSVAVGTQMKIYYTLDTSQGYWQMRIAKGSGWSALPTTNDPIDLAAGTESYTLTLTSEILNALVNEGGLILTGCNYTVTKITFIVE